VSATEIREWINLFGWPGLILILMWKDVLCWGKDKEFWKGLALKSMDRADEALDAALQREHKRGRRDSA
jgi:hypothetical protein